MPWVKINPQYPGYVFDIENGCFVPYDVSLADLAAPQNVRYIKDLAAPQAVRYDPPAKQALRYDPSAVSDTARRARWDALERSDRPLYTYRLIGSLPYWTPLLPITFDENPRLVPPSCTYTVLMFQAGCFDETLADGHDIFLTNGHKGENLARTGDYSLKLTSVHEGLVVEADFTSHEFFQEWNALSMAFSTLACAHHADQSIPGTDIRKAALIHVAIVGSGRNPKARARITRLA